MMDILVSWRVCNPPKKMFVKVSLLGFVKPAKAILTFTPITSLEPRKKASYFALYWLFKRFIIIPI